MHPIKATFIIFTTLFVTSYATSALNLATAKICTSQCDRKLLDRIKKIEAKLVGGKSTLLFRPSGGSLELDN